MGARDGESGVEQEEEVGWSRGGGGVGQGGRRVEQGRRWVEVDRGRGGGGFEERGRSPGREEATTFAVVVDAADCDEAIDFDEAMQHMTHCLLFT